MKNNRKTILVRTYGSFSMRLAAGVLAIILFVVILAGLSLYQSKRQYEKQVMISTQNLSQLLDKNIHHIINKTDLALLAIADEINRQIASGGINKQTLNAFIGKQKERLIVADSLRMANAEGMVSYGTAVETASKTNIADREHFTRPRDNPNVKLFISKPVITRIDKKWALPLSCRLSRPDGSFGGIVYANIDIKTFINTFSSLNIGSNGTIVMRDQELRIIARYPEPGGYGSTIGMKETEPEILALIRAGAQTGSFHTYSALDKTERICSFRKLSDYPLYICVGRNTSEYLTGWWQELTKTIAILMLFIAIVLYFSHQILFRWRGELKALEDLRKANDDLENRIVERTAEISKVNEKLQVEFTEHKRTEVELQRSEQRYRLVVENTNEAIVVVQDGWVKFVNRGIEWAGYTPEEYMAIPVMETIHPEDREVVGQRYLEKISGLTTPTRHTYRGLSKSGRIHWIEVSSVLIDWEGRPATLNLITDITERKQAEAHKEQLEVQNRQLQKAESLDRMAASIAHTFNNQLGAVIGNLEMAIDDLPKGSGLFNSLTAAMQAAQKSAEVSGMMLTYLGQSFDNRKVLDLAEVCRRNLPILKATLPGNAALETSLPSPGPVIMASESQLHQVLMILITNAWEAMGKGGGSIHLGVKMLSSADITDGNRRPIDWQPQDSAYACMEVTDSGCGIADDDIEKLFDPFFSSKFTGRGLGLPVALGIVKAHDGVITIESQSGRGSTFRVFLPVSARKEIRKPDKIFKASAMNGGGTILLVEDEEMMRNMAAAMLKRLGFSVLEAKDGVEAVAIFRQRHDEIRLVLSDLTMPRMNGWETLTALRKIAPGIPVILASGYDKAQVMAGDHPELPQIFLSKPYKLNGLRDAISQAIGQQQGKR